MTQRISERNVSGAFDRFLGAYKALGVDVEGWQLKWGNSSYGYQFRVLGADGENITRDLGSSKREAYDALHNMAHALDSLSKLLV